MTRARDIADRVLHNRTHEDTEGGRESIVTFKGEQSGGEISTLAQIQASHDGTADDQKADLIFKTNDGSDNAAPTERLRIDSDGSIVPATLGTSNVKLGLNAGKVIASGGNYNTVIGEEAGAALSTGDVNTFVGYQSGDATTTSGNNVGVGYASLTTNILSSKNVAIGNNALKTHNLGSAGDGLNAAVGHGAGELITTGTKNTIIGGFDGNQHGWDMRTKNSASVISDGDGELQGLFYGTSNMTMKLSRVTTDGFNYHPNIIAAAENLSDDFTTGAGIATIVTADYVLPYQKQVMLQVAVGSSAYWNHVTYMLTCNYSNVSATTLASVFNGSGNLTINSIGISFTGAYNSRKVAITLTPSSGTALSNFQVYLHYAPSTYNGSGDLYV